MIEEAYCSYEVSKLLREKGFEEICIAYYEDFGKKQHLYMRDKRGAYNKGFKQHDSLAIRFNTKKDNYKCSAPTQQMAMRWLREVHNIVISICNGNHKKDNRDRTTPDYVYFFFTITDSYAYYDENKQCFDEFNTYEEAVEAAIKYVLKNLI